MEISRDFEIAELEHAFENEVMDTITEKAMHDQVLQYFTTFMTRDNAPQEPDLDDKLGDDDPNNVEYKKISMIDLALGTSKVTYRHQNYAILTC